MDITTLVLIFFGLAGSVITPLIAPIAPLFLLMETYALGVICLNSGCREATATAVLGLVAAVIAAVVAGLVLVRLIQRVRAGTRNASIDEPAV